MADNNEIEIKITLDDGSIVKGLANIKKGTNQVTKEAEGLADQFDQAFEGSNISGFINKVKTLNPVLLGAAAAAGTVFASFQSALAGEEILRIGKQFDLLADQAGLAGDEISQGLIAAADGLADTEDVLKSASTAIVALGDNANRLPEVFELARRSALIFGGDAVERFEQLNTAIANGSARQLKALGLVIDTEKVYKDFAATLGITSEQLNINQKQFALLNATLEKGKDAFSGVDVESNNLGNAYQRLKISVGEVLDTIAVANRNAFGDAFTSLLTSAGTAIDNFNLKLKNVSGIEITVDEKIKLLNEQLAENTRLAGGFINPGLAENLRAENNLIRDQIALLKDQRDAAEEANFMKALKSTPTGESGTELTPEQIAAQRSKQLADELAFNQQLLSIRSQVTAQRLQSAQLINDEETRLAELAKVRNEQLLNENLQNSINEQTIEKQFAEQKIINENQKNILLEEEEKRHKAAMKIIEDQAAADDLKRQETLSKQLTAIRDAGLKNVFKATAMALAEGKNAFEVFGKGILSLMGNILMETGASLILIGLGMEAIRASILGLTGGPAIFAGVALLGLGALLSKLGGGGSSASASTSSSGSSGTSGSTDFNTTPEAAAAVEEKTTKVNIDVQGTVLNPIQVGQQIAQILNETFDATGTKVMTGVA